MHITSYAIDVTTYPIDMQKILANIQIFTYLVDVTTDISGSYI